MVEVIPLHRLRVGYSPRTHRHDVHHAALLARSGAALPPIVVNRATMEVIDGHHRVLAAQMCGEDTIRACFFDGSGAEAMLEAIRANIRGGKPLSLAERKRAACDVLIRLPHLSDRAVSECCGLSPRTVRGLWPHATAPPGSSVRRLERGEPKGASASIGERQGVTGHPAGSGSAALPTSEHRSPSAWLRSTDVTDGEWSRFAVQVPTEQLAGAIVEARRRSRGWSDLAAMLESRRRHEGARGSAGRADRPADPGP